LFSDFFTILNVDFCEGSIYTREPQLKFRFRVGNKVHEKKQAGLLGLKTKRAFIGTSLPVPSAQKKK
jgi:hypothetical protein